MYATRVQIHNYGPVGHLDISLPFDGDIPKPILLVGENGSGKSILLSHIVNGLMEGQRIAYKDSSEVATGKVYKLRHGNYIRSNNEYYFARADFQDGLFVSEIVTRQEKRNYSEVPEGLEAGDANVAWDSLRPNRYDHFMSNMSDSTNRDKLDRIFASNCVLYFPPNRFEEPAWLNEENLKAKAHYMDLKHLQGHTDRRILNYSRLYENQNWLFEVIYDRAAFEIQTGNYNLPIADSDATIPLPLFTGYSGDATRTYDITLQIVQKAVKEGQNARFGIGRRHNRVVSIESDSGTLVPNIFQLSSGETALLNMFLSILRDFDICGASFAGASDIRGIAVVDEIDLHLNAIHQHDILPALIRMFPKVQFVVTTHSPLFVLGMEKFLGKTGLPCIGCLRGN